MTNPTLHDLGYDIFENIISYILSEEELQNVISLSMVSKQMRHYALPVMFGRVQWPKGPETEFFPSSLWPYIRTLEFVPPMTLRHKACTEMLSKALPHLPELFTFIYITKSPPTVPFIQALVACSSLHSLHLSTACLIHEAFTLFRSFRGILRLVIEQVGQATLYSAPLNKRAISLQCVADLIQGCGNTLEILEIPGEYCPLADLYSQSIALPQLRRLVLTGLPPLESDSIKYPLWAIVRSMKSLNVLQVHCRFRIIGAVAHRYALLPIDAPSQDVNQTQDVDHYPSSQLESVVISNPSLSDRIFERLPSSLRSLVLDFIPVWENMLVSGDTLAYHKPQKLIQLFELMGGAANSLSHPNIEQLCIKMGWCVTPDILHTIYNIFPGLRGLELQGIQYFNRAEEPESDMESIVGCLRKFKQLQTLKLAVELPENRYREEFSQFRDIGAVDHAMKHWAKVLQEQISSLECVAFENRRHTGKGLGRSRRAAMRDPLPLPALMTTNSFYSVDAGSSRIGLAPEPEMITKSYQDALDEFCLMLTSDAKDVHFPTTRRFSHVHSWRKAIVPLEIAPPSSPFAVSNFPASPVAAINPEQLCVTSLPPYDTRTAALLSGTAPRAIAEPSPVEETMHFYDLYDAQLERMINELEASSDSSSAASATIYLPPVAPSVVTASPPSRKFSSTVRWLPVRIKYSLLSGTFRKVFHR
ncbi:hypothetical protein D9757_012109 [Collybiopsis confluens]|uniref:F-box domain-containing protein n=1 Tax=Collybiopsis confluens TaxID=2823264 RepID=A0A8H5D552_9AGAR|nr:hypothetical protein D9757_012109 [Collybiopsis confluens]